MVQKWFGTDGIRGIWGHPPMDLPSLNRIGAALAAFYRQRSPKKQLLIAEDTRASCKIIRDILTAHLVAAELSVYTLGVCPTPGLSYMIRHLNSAGGIMISASHNPANHNGLKIFKELGQKVTHADIQEIETGILRAKTVRPKVSQAGQKGSNKPYISFLQRKAEKLSLQHKHFVLDCANGAFSHLAQPILEATGAKITTIFNRPNGQNINTECGATHLHALCQAVQEHSADGGFAFDGDGDRLMACSAKCEILDGDHILAALGGYLQTQGKLVPPMIISTIMSNQGLTAMLNKKGIRLETTAVGDHAVYEKMIETSAILGGEPSGHILFKENFYHGDALFALLSFLEGIFSGNTQQKIEPQMQSHTQAHANLKTDYLSSDARKRLPELVQSLQKEVKKTARIVARHSGTEPLLRLMVESNHKEDAQKILKKLEALVRNI